jgi:YebC/PmpR family DNA-binding regulatory protein
MSGHSKWKTIKHQKAIKDARRGQQFTKVIRAITVAAQKGGPDPEANPTLRDAIAAAKNANMPKSNIENAIKRATEKGRGGALQELSLEGYGPAGVAIVLTAITDNRNRTVAEIRRIFERCGGSLGEQGSAAYIFADPEKPLFEVRIEDRENAKKVLDLVNTLDEHPDVQKVRANFDILEELVE